MLEKVKRYVEKYKMLTSEDRVIIGVSGGADSICLLLLLLELKKECGFSLFAVHVNHGLRGENAKNDEDYVKTFCEQYHVPLEIYHMDVESIAKKRKQSTEEAGRNVRKECFMDAMEKYAGTKIALAHHKNDNVETVLFRFARGTGLKGLRGIEPIRDCFIRPLLCLERKEIESYLKEKDVPYCTDETNASDVYARNLIRNQVIPHLEKGVNSRAVEHMNRTMEYLGMVQDYMEEQVALYEEACTVHLCDGILIDEKKFAKVPKVLQLLLVKNILISIAGMEKDLEEVHVLQILELFHKQTGRKLDLPYAVSAKRVYEGVKLSHKKEVSSTCDQDFSLDFTLDQGSFQLGEWRVEYQILEKGKNIDTSFEKKHTKVFSYDIIKDNIHFRTRRPGDYITIHPDGRTQKLKTYFINEKIPEEERDRILLVAEGNHILWIVGYRTSCAYYVTKETKQILKIKVDKGERNGRDS